ncbi:MAG: hypothetical protein KAR42_17755 [candidate division Zixibacteria bacterium]|nr:hypothetical protein [candidate division Zixibacteria bacterium]
MRIDSSVSFEINSSGHVLTARLHRGSMCGNCGGNAPWNSKTDSHQCEHCLAFCFIDWDKED